MTLPCLITWNIRNHFYLLSLVTEQLSCWCMLSHWIWVDDAAFCCVFRYSFIHVHSSVFDFSQLFLPETYLCLNFLLLPWTSDMFMSTLASDMYMYIEVPKLFSSASGIIVFKFSWSLLLFFLPYHLLTACSMCETAYVFLLFISPFIKFLNFFSFSLLFFEIICGSHCKS